MNFSVGSTGGKGLSDSMIMVSISCKNKACACAESHLFIDSLTNPSCSKVLVM